MAFNISRRRDMSPRPALLATQSRNSEPLRSFPGGARARPSSRQACGGAAGGLECPGGQARRKFSRVSRVYTRASSLQCGPHLDRRHH
jgi:hypothetical protein